MILADRLITSKNREYMTKIDKTEWLIRALARVYRVPSSTATRVLLRLGLASWNAYKSQILSDPRFHKDFAWVLRHLQINRTER